LRINLTVSKLRDQIGTRGLVIAGLCAVCLGLTGAFALDSGLHADDFHLAGRIDRPFFSSADAYLDGPDPEARRHFRPVTRIVQQALLSIDGLSAPILHGFNLLLHCLSVWLLFRLIHSISRDDRIAFWAAALFAIHPAHTEPLIWVSGISTLGETVLHLAALVALDRWLQRPRWADGLIVLMAFVLASLFKESAMTFLLTGTVLWWFRGFRPRIPWPMISAVGWVILLAFWRSAAGVDTSANWVRLTPNPIAWMRNFAFYLTQFALPVRSLFRIWGFESYYALRDSFPVLPSQLGVMIAIGTAGLTGLYTIIRTHNRWPRTIKLALALAIAAIAPFLAAVDTGMRLMYHASAWFSLGIVILVFLKHNHRWVRTLFYVWMIVMSFSLVERATVWHTAGHLADRILTEGIAVRNSHPPDQTVIFTDVPDRYEGAFVFPGFLVEALGYRIAVPSAPMIDVGKNGIAAGDVPVNAVWYQWTDSGFKSTIPPDSSPDSTD
jgi:hypothetical protein